jgi:hypothetical protein
MRERINLKKTYKTKVFGEYIYPVFHKEFLFGSDYTEFAELVNSKFELSTDQWDCILIEWEFKEKLLSE